MGKKPHPPTPSSTGEGEAEADLTPQPTSPQGKGETEAPFAPESLARTLRAVAAELERDPALARRVADAIAGSEHDAPAPSPADAPRGEPESPSGKKGGVNQSFRPRLVTGASPELGSGVPDPFALVKRRGEPALRAALDELRLGTLRAIVREHKLDPGGKLARLNDAQKLREAILAAVRG
ncbi:MAG TPA: hypothetical protein VJN88_08800 [Ktedonobacterales bacterium]|nr:hypothetical protein [Ktedonobacterales bacterium]